jgi:hypothetical protein
VKRAAAVLFLTLASPAAAAEVAVKAAVSPKQATVGDEIRLIIRLEHPEGTTPVPPDPRADVSPFEMKRVEPLPSRSDGARRVDGYAVVLTAFQTGEWKVPPVTVGAADAAGRVQRAATPPLPVRIVSVAPKLSEKDDIKPIKGPLRLDPGPVRDAALGLLALALAAVLAVRLWRRRKTPVDPETLKPPHERALLELGRLRHAGLLAQRRVKDHFTELAGIARRYLERRYGLDVMESTTAETLARLREGGHAAGELDRLREVLETADLVKFANHEPSRQASEVLTDRLAEFVAATKPEPPAAEKRP